MFLKGYMMQMTFSPTSFCNLQDLVGVKTGWLRGRTYSTTNNVGRTVRLDKNIIYFTINQIDREKKSVFCTNKNGRILPVHAGVLFTIDDVFIEDIYGVDLTTWPVFILKCRYLYVLSLLSREVWFKKAFADADRVYFPYNHSFFWFNNITKIQMLHYISLLNKIGMNYMPVVNIPHMKHILPKHLQKVMHL